MAPSKQPRMRSRRLLAAAAAVFALVSAPGPSWSCELLELCVSSGSSPQPRTAPAPRGAAWLLSAINEERRANGVPTVAGDASLDAFATEHANRLARAARVFHNEAGLAERRSRTGESLGENVGLGADVPGVHRAFLGSASHRATILSDWDRVGLGIARRAGETYVVEVFAREGAVQRAQPAVPQPVRKAGPAGHPVLVGRHAADASAPQPSLAVSQPSRFGPLPWVGLGVVGLGIQLARRLRRWIG